MAKSPKREAARLDEDELPPVIHTSTVVRISGLTARHLHRLVFEGRIPADCNFSGDKWRSEIVLRELFSYKTRQADRAKPPSDRLLDLQQRQADLKTTNIKNAKLMRELLPRFVYVQVWGELLSSFKARWMGFAHKMGPRAFRAKDKVEAAEILDREVTEIFSALNDPKFMEDIAAKVTDEEFDQPIETDSDSRIREHGRPEDEGGEGGGAHLEPPDA